MARRRASIWISATTAAGSGNWRDDRDVFNCFCYTGGFSIAALAGGARSVVSIDSSAEALALASLHVTDNGLDAARAEWRDADVFSELRKLRDGARDFDLIVLDPPKFAPTAHHAERATRAYKDMNLLALKLLRPGGLLATFSCSGGVSAELFQKVVAGAALDARADAAIVGRFGPSADHPVALDFPEGDYLKGLLDPQTRIATRRRIAPTPRVMHSYAFTFFERHVFMKSLRSAPFLPVACFEHCRILSCCETSTGAAGAGAVAEVACAWTSVWPQCRPPARDDAPTPRNVASKSGHEHLQFTLSPSRLS